MTGQELYDLHTALLGGTEINTVLFYQLINMAKKKREARRDWTWLKAKDSSISWLSSDTPSTGKTLPANFARPIKGTVRSTPIVFIDSAGKKQGTASEVQLENQYDYQDTQGYFFIDYGEDTPKLYFTAAAPQTLTAVLFYISNTPDITEASTWDRCPAAYHPLLAYDVSMMQKGDIDYDEINARMVEFSGVSASDLESSMIMEDERIKLSALQV